MIRVAQVQGAFGHAVKAHHQLFGLPLGGPVLAHGLRQCGDVARIVMVVVHKPQLGNQPCFKAPAVHRVKHAGGGGAAVLRVGGHDQDALNAFSFEGVQLFGDGRLAVAHGVTHCDAEAALLQCVAQ